jgi:hypothetical protein
MQMRHGNCAKCKESGWQMPHVGWLCGAGSVGRTFVMPSRADQIRIQGSAKFIRMMLGVLYACSTIPTSSPRTLWPVFSCRAQLASPSSLLPPSNWRLRIVSRHRYHPRFPHIWTLRIRHLPTSSPAHSSIYTARAGFAKLVLNARPLRP